MAWTLTDDVGHFQQAVGALLRAEPERNTVLLSVAARLARLGGHAFGDAAPVLGWWPSDSAPRAAALQTPPWPVLVTTLPGESARELASALAGRGTTLSGVNGTQADATALATEWQALTGANVRTHQRQRLQAARAAAARPASLRHGEDRWRGRRSSGGVVVLRLQRRDRSGGRGRGDRQGPARCGPAHALGGVRRAGARGRVGR